MAEAGGGDTETRWQRIWREAKEARGAAGPWQMALALAFALVELLRELISVLCRVVGERLPEVLRWTAFGLAIVAAVTVGAHPGWWAANTWFTDDPCLRPRELRVVTTPDTYQVLRTEAAGFMAEQQRNGCDVTVTINSVDTFDDLRAAFASAEGAWKPEVRRVPLVPGPHPDIVIPALTAQAEWLRSVGQDDFALENEGSLATSDVVLAVPTAYDLHDGDLRSLLAAAKEKLLRVARPDPERSEAALLSTRPLYGLDAMRPAGAREREKLEAGVSPSDVGLDSATAPFCRGGDMNLGIVLPRHVFNAFDTKQIPRSLCAGSALKDVDYKPIKITDVPVLDYPFIRVRWPGQASRERDQLIGEFRTWLQEHLPSHGFKATAKAGSGLSERQYEDTLTAYREARREIKVLFLLDYSGSMHRDVADGRSLDRGGRLIGRITDRLGDNDWAALWAIPGEDRDGARRQVEGGPVVLAQKRRIKNQVAALELAKGEHSPIYAGLVHVVRRTPEPGELTVVLVTDGENRIRQGEPVEDRPFDSAVAELASVGTRLEVLANVSTSA
jgi:hypothetical protein